MSEEKPLVWNCWDCSKHFKNKPYYHIAIGHFVDPCYKSDFNDSSLDQFELKLVS